MTPFTKKKDLKNNWYLVNADNVVVGRLAAYISKLLRGKNKPQYNPNIDNGDFVIVNEQIEQGGLTFGRVVALGIGYASAIITVGTPLYVEDFSLKAKILGAAVAVVSDIDQIHL